MEMLGMIARFSDPFEFCPYIIRAFDEKVKIIL